MRPIISKRVKLISYYTQNFVLLNIPFTFRGYDIEPHITPLLYLSFPICNVLRAISSEQVDWREFQMSLKNVNTLFRQLNVGRRRKGWTQVCVHSGTERVKICIVSRIFQKRITFFFLYKNKSKNITFVHTKETFFMRLCQTRL